MSGLISKDAVIKLIKGIEGQDLFYVDEIRVIPKNKTIEAIEAMPCSDDWQRELALAYEVGCKDTHDAWMTENHQHVDDPEFGEAASDYAASVFMRLNCNNTEQPDSVGALKDKGVLS